MFDVPAGDIFRYLAVITAVGSVAFGFCLSRRRRAAATVRAGGRRWWIGDRQTPVRPSVLFGWLAFVVLNAVLSVTQPAVAFALLYRAWLFRAICLRKPARA